ncbi:hypothetical protein LCL87_25465 [Rhodococcus hoagii]|nr:hypothetical protein [Prescottella equi]
MTETRKPAPVQRDGQAPTNRKEKQMHDKTTAETLDEAIARMNNLLERRWWFMEGSQALFGGWRVAAPLPTGVTHPEMDESLSIAAEGPDLATLVSTVANKVAEALAMRGAA